MLTDRAHSRSHQRYDTHDGYRIRVALSYEMQNGEVDTLYEDYACDDDGRIRKVTPKDFAAFHGETYTIGESFPIPE